MPVVAPTVDTPPPSHTAIPPTTTSTPHPTQTATLMPPATLEPQQAEAAIRALLRESECLAPCFWGIIPGQSTSSEVKSVFTYLGLPFEHAVEPEGKESYGILRKFDNGLSLLIGLKLQNGFVKNMRMYISPESSEAPQSPREWLAYSPETLIRQYGTPSKVDIFGGMSGELGDSLDLAYGVNMYFDAVDLVVEYYSAYDYVKADPTTGMVRVCPLTDQFQSIRILSGMNPEPYISTGFPVEEAASMTLEEFSELMTGDAEKACFDLSKEIFQ